MNPLILLLYLSEECGLCVTEVSSGFPQNIKVNRLLDIDFRSFSVYLSEFSYHIICSHRKVTEFFKNRYIMFNYITGKIELHRLLVLLWFIMLVSLLLVLFLEHNFNKWMHIFKFFCQEFNMQFSVPEHPVFCNEIYRRRNEDRVKKIVCLVKVQEERKNVINYLYKEEVRK